MTRPCPLILGSSAWALQASTLLLQVAAAAAVLWLSWRRGGPGVALGVVAVIAGVIAEILPALRAARLSGGGAMVCV